MHMTTAMAAGTAFGRADSISRHRPDDVASGWIRTKSGVACSGDEPDPYRQHSDHRPLGGWRDAHSRARTSP